MFMKLRETLRIISHKEDLAKRPDVVFGEDESLKPTRFSKAIAWAIEAGVLIFLVFLGGKLVTALWKLASSSETETTLSAKVITIIASAVFLAIGTYCLHKLNHEVELRLRIAERIAPYFGHRLEATVRILKG